MIYITDQGIHVPQGVGQYKLRQFNDWLDMVADINRLRPQGDEPIDIICSVKEYVHNRVIHTCLVWPAHDETVNGYGWRPPQDGDTVYAITLISGSLEAVYHRADFRAKIGAK